MGAGKDPLAESVEASENRKMNTKDIQGFLENVCGKVDCTRDVELDLLESLVRGEWDGIPTVGVGGELSAKAQISSLVDAIHWCRQKHPSASVLRFVIGKGDHSDEVLEALATLIAARHPESVPTLEFMLDGEATSLPVRPNFDTKNAKRWMEFLEKRFKKEAPKLVTRLSEAVDNPSFRWYLGVSAKYWSGRVEGLEVCIVDPDCEKGWMRDFCNGRNGNRSIAGEEVAGLLEGAPKEFDNSQVKSVAAAILSVVEARQNKKSIRNYQPEHWFESRILRGEIPIPAGNRPGAGSLKHVFEKTPFQFPAQWHMKDEARYIDILMCEGNVPWVVELKYGKKWRGQYYRHAISQGVLYREFIKRAPAVQEFFKNKMRLDAAACKAIVVFPNPAPECQRHLDGLRELAAEFDIEVVTFENVL